jgi:hypothetical protein
MEGSKINSRVVFEYKCRYTFLEVLRFRPDESLAFALMNFELYFQVTLEHRLLFSKLQCIVQDGLILSME